MGACHGKKLSHRSEANHLQLRTIIKAINYYRQTIIIIMNAGEFLDTFFDGSDKYNGGFN